MNRAAWWFLGASVNVVVSLPLVLMVAVAGCLTWSVRELYTTVSEWLPAGEPAHATPSMAGAATMGAALGVSEP